MTVTANDDQWSSVERLKARVREEPLLERLKKSHHLISLMCGNGRPPRMTIPVQFDDEDFYISTTLEDAIAALQHENT